MKSSSYLKPLKTEMEFHNNVGELLKSPRIVKTMSYHNKGRNKEWYVERARKNFGVEVQINWS